MGMASPLGISARGREVLIPVSQSTGNLNKKGRNTPSPIRIGSCFNGGIQASPTSSLHFSPGGSSISSPGSPDSAASSISPFSNRSPSAVKPQGKKVTFSLPNEPSTIHFSVKPILYSPTRSEFSSLGTSCRALNIGKPTEKEIGTEAVFPSTDESYNFTDQLDKKQLSEIKSIVSWGNDLDNVGTLNSNKVSKNCAYSPAINKYLGKDFISRDDYEKFVSELSPEEFKEIREFAIWHSSNSEDKNSENNLQIYWMNVGMPKKKDEVLSNWPEVIILPQEKSMPLPASFSGQKIVAASCRVLPGDTEEFSISKLSQQQKTPLEDGDSSLMSIRHEGLDVAHKDAPENTGFFSIGAKYNNFIEYLKINDNLKEGFKDGEVEISWNSGGKKTKFSKPVDGGKNLSIWDIGGKIKEKKEGKEKKEKAISFIVNKFIEKCGEKEESPEDENKINNKYREKLFHRALNKSKFKKERIIEIIGKFQSCEESLWRRGNETLE